MSALKELKAKYKLGELSQIEWVLIAFVLFCVGIILGMAISPKGNRAIASNNSNNGNSNGNNNQGSVDKTKKEN